MSIIGIIPKEWKNKWFLYVSISMIIFLVIWFIGESPKTFKIISNAILIVAYLFYIINVKKEDEDIFFPKFINYAYLIIMIFFFIAYIAVAVKEPSIAGFTLIFSFLLILMGGLILHILNLWKSQGLLKVIISYLGLTITAIILFGLVFSIASGFDGNGLKWNDGSNVENARNFVYFSASVFYSTTFCDISPFGYSRLIVFFELAFSFIIHIIILGITISKLNIHKKNNKDVAKIETDISA